jgi:hypothetical protein
MKLPVEVVIPREKLTHYLLAPRTKNDKSRYLAQIGFVRSTPDLLETALRELIRVNDAVMDREDVYGVYYRVEGDLRGPGGILRITTVWIRRHIDHTVRFVTLKPLR